MLQWSKVIHVSEVHIYVYYMVFTMSGFGRTMYQTSKFVISEYFRAFGIP